MKTKEINYLLLFVDNKDNVLTTKEILELSYNDAMKTRDRIFANCMINDCVKIKIAKML